MATKKHSKHSSPARNIPADATVPIDKIAMRAYDKWCKRGCPAGSDQLYWVEAEAELKAELEAARGRSSRRGAGLTAKTSLVSGKSLQQERKHYIASLERELHDDAPSVREAALGKLAFFGGTEGVLLIISALDDSSPRVRAQARDLFFATYRELPFSPKVREYLESNESRTRKKGMREIATLLPNAIEAIAARFPGWEALLALTETTLMEETPDPPLPLEKPPSVAGRGAITVTEDPPMNQQNGPPISGVSAQKHLIRIPQHTDRVKAITAFRRVRATRVTLPDNVMGVSAEHIQVLERENIPFQFVSQAPNGKSASV